MYHYIRILLINVDQISGKNKEMRFPYSFIFLFAIYLLKTKQEIRPIGKTANIFSSKSISVSEQFGPSTLSNYKFLATRCFTHTRSQKLVNESNFL